MNQSPTKMEFIAALKTDWLRCVEQAELTPRRIVEIRHQFVVAIARAHSDGREVEVREVGNRE